MRAWRHLRDRLDRLDQSEVGDTILGAAHALTLVLILVIFLLGVTA